LGEIKVFPNPATSKLFVSSPEGSEITIYSLLGEKVKSIKTVSEVSAIYVADMQDGFYIIQIKNGGKTISKKVTVSKKGKR
jgi:hypothetical protein